MLNSIVSFVQHFEKDFSFLLRKIKVVFLCKKHIFVVKISAFLSSFYGETWWKVLYSSKISSFAIRLISRRKNININIFVHSLSETVFVKSPSCRAERSLFFVERNDQFIILGKSSNQFLHHSGPASFSQILSDPLMQAYVS